MVFMGQSRSGSGGWGVGVGMGETRGTGVEEGRGKEGFQNQFCRIRNFMLFSMNTGLSVPHRALLCFTKDHYSLNYSAFWMSVYLSWLNNIVVCYLFVFCFSSPAINHMRALFCTNKACPVTKSALMKVYLEDLL